MNCATITFPPSAVAPHGAGTAIRYTEVSCPMSRPRGIRARWQTARERLPIILAYVASAVLGVIVGLGLLCLMEAVVRGIVFARAGLTS